MKEETEKETNEFDIAELFGAIPADGIRIAVSGMRRADGGCRCFPDGLRAQDQKLEPAD